MVHPSRLTISFLVALCATCSASAQLLGLGGGLAMPSNEVAQLPGELQQQGWGAIEQRAAQGAYLELRARFGGDMALTAALSYNDFQRTTSRFTDPTGSQVELRTSQVIVPLSIGVERRSTGGTLGLIASLEAEASFHFRSFTSVGGSPVPFELQREDVVHFGLAIGAGASLDLSLVRLDLVARLHLLNLVGATSTTEQTTLYAQLGAMVYLGL